MIQSARKTKKTATKLSISLQPEESIANVVSLQTDLMSAFQLAEARKISLDASKTMKVDMAFLQIWRAATQHAVESSQSIELTGLSESVKNSFEMSGISPNA